jgi:uncharacterized membrane protein
VSSSVEKGEAFRFAPSVPTTQKVNVSCEVNEPIWRVYQNWKRLDRFPSFVPSVKEARWLSRNRLYWREEHDGADYESTYAITLHLRENGLEWQSLSGPESSGTARCEALPRGGSRLTLSIDYVPDAESQSPASVRGRHERYLRAFKAFVESAPPSKA